MPSLPADSLQKYADTVRVIRYGPVRWSDAQSTARGQRAGWRDSVSVSPRFVAFVDPMPGFLDAVKFAGAGIQPLRPSPLADQLPIANDSVSNSTGFRYQLLDPRPPLVDSVTRFQQVPTVSHAWVTEPLQGPIDGVNVTFSVSHIPIVESMTIWDGGIRLVRVTGTPVSGEAQYGVLGTTVIAGRPPKIGSVLISRYFWDH